MWGSKKKAAPKKPVAKGVKKAAVGRKKAPVKKHAEKAAPPSIDKIEEEAKTIFQIYATDKEGSKQIIGSEGIQNLCNDLDIDLTASAEILVFMWHCE